MIRPLKGEDRKQVIELVTATKNFNEAEVAIAQELIDICVEQPEQQDYYAFVEEVADNMSPATPPSQVTQGTPLTDTRIAGFLLLGPTPATTGTYDMYWIAVHPEFYGRGIAQSLDQFAVQFVRERNGYWLIAETSGQAAYERTRAFYTKQGYQILAQIPDYYKKDDALIIFGKRLGEAI